MRSVYHGAIALLAALSATWAQAATPVSHVIVLHPGQSIADAVFESDVSARVAGLAADWQARHPGQVADLGKPQITSGTIVSQSVDVSNPLSVPVLSIHYKAANGLFLAAFQFISPNGVQTTQFTYAEGAFTRSGEVTFASGNQLTPFAQPGVWTLRAAYVVDWAGIQRNYNAAQLAELFLTPGFTVVNNGLSDFTPPNVISGKLLTRTVSLSSTFPDFEASLELSDDVSGVSLPLVFVEQPQSNFSFAGSYALPIPEKRGVAVSYLPLGPSAPTGTWHIVGYGACDFAFNCGEIKGRAAARALFGTDAFTVTN